MPSPLVKTRPMGRIVFLLILTSFFLASPILARSDVIYMSETGFSPNVIEVTQGTTITFENAGNQPHWPASNIHPTHQIYPEFDPKVGISMGKSWSFTFNKAGVWRFHDHLFPQFTGTITVNSLSLPKTNGFLANVLKMLKSIVNPLVHFLQRNSTHEVNSTSKLSIKGTIDPNVAQDAQNLFSNEGILYSYVKKYGPKQTITHLNELSSQYGDCHQTAHKAGRFAYELYGEKAFQTCGAECHSGCYHGATEAYFKDHGTANLAQNLQVICSSELNPFFSHQCIHGIGHGLMAWSNYEIHEALKNCDLLPQKQDSCYSGVFMENIVGGLAQEAGHQTNYLNADPQFPCTIVDEKYKSACYFYQTSRMVQLFPNDFARVAQICNQVPTQYQAVCFSSMGRDADGVYRGQPTQAITSCNNAPSGLMRESCLSGAVQDAFWDPSGSDSALTFCKLLTSQSEKQICYNTIIGRAVDVLTDRTVRKTFCDQVEPFYQDLCDRLLKT